MKIEEDNKYIIHKTHDGSRVERINSLGDLIGCEVIQVESHTHIPHGGYPQILIFSNMGKDEEYRLDNRTYKDLRFGYLKSGKPDIFVDGLIERVDKVLDKINHNYSRV